jgi:hypothetical protein
MSDQPTPEEWERAIASYQQSYRKLIAFATHLLETGRDLTEVASIIDGLTEAQAKGILKVVLASDANDYTEKRERSRLN